MSAASARYIPEGFQTVTPYLVVPGVAKLIDFLHAVFGAEEKFRSPRPDGSIQHAEVRIGDSIVEMGEPLKEKWDQMPAALHCYLPNVDAIYERAVKAGANILTKPTQMDYGDYETDFEDPSGTQWYVGMRKSGGSIAPEGFHSVNIGLRADGAKELIAFLKSSFGAETQFYKETEDGKVAYSTLRLGNSILEVTDPHGPWTARPTGLHFYVEDCDAVFVRAIAAGCKLLFPVADQPYGERSGGAEDAWGNHWYIATRT
ncbi:MAG TPA: VOC family protein [Candidatus Acidoferrum sp.]|nr:VOC family protein [Candidatus Acidoferrum sp.]